ncbi:MAG: hypothetical protein AB8E15_08825 [Bdellovibrionales bacterium]
MLGDNVFLAGLDPSSMEHQNIKYKLLGLLEEAPSDASVRYKFINEAEGAVSILKVYSRQGKFVASFGGKLAEDSCGHCIEDVIRQINTWKSTRFSEEAV